MIVCLVRSATKLANAICADFRNASLTKERDCFVDMIFVLRHRDNTCAKTQPRGENCIDAAHSFAMTSSFLRDFVVNLGAMRVHRRCDVHIVLDKTIEQRLRQSRQICKDLDELIVERSCARDEIGQSSIERRLTTDELYLLTAELGGRGQYVEVIIRSQAIVAAGERTRLGVAVNALQIAAVGELEPEELHTLGCAWHSGARRNRHTASFSTNILTTDESGKGRSLRRTKFARLFTLFHYTQENVMAGINYLAVIVAAIASMVVGGIWNSPFAFGTERMKLAGMSAIASSDRQMPVGKLLAQFVRSVIVAFVLARFVVLLGISDWMGALQLALWVWIGFNGALLIGAVIWENQPWKLYAIHAGDALVQTIVMAIILGIWR